MSHQALLVIDPQNDYFPGGKYPLWNTEETLRQIKAAIEQANIEKIPVILIQHEADPKKGPAPFFNQGTTGVEIHPEILAAAPDAPVVIKRFADGFEQTELDALLQQCNIDEIILCGMMTQNCITHTALSKAAEKYQVSVLAAACTTVDEMIHRIALNAISVRVRLSELQEIKRM